MNIHITGRHVEITQGLRDHIAEKLSHLEKLFERVIDIHIVLAIDHGQNIAEATAHVPHMTTIHAKAETGDMYASIDSMVDKVKVQVQKHKEREITERDHPHHADDQE